MKEEFDVQVSKRLDHFETGIFAALDEKKEELMKSGRKVYNLFVGTPDFPVADYVIEALVEAAKDPENFRYTLRDTQELLLAVKEYYKERYGVEVCTEEITFEAAAISLAMKAFRVLFLLIHKVRDNYQ